MTYEANPEPFGYRDPEDELEDALIRERKLLDTNRLLSGENERLKRELAEATSAGKTRQPLLYAVDTGESFYATIMQRNIETLSLASAALGRPVGLAGIALAAQNRPRISN